MVKATFFLWIRTVKRTLSGVLERLLIWFLQVIFIQYFSEVTAVQLLVDGMITDNATFNLWMRV
jgi:hypothetical protein